MALSAECMAAWMAADLSQLDLVAIQIEVCMSATTWCWSRPSGSTPTEGATENAAVVQALIDSRARARRLARRGLVWINVTAHPTAEWIAQQITEAFPWPAYTTETCAKSSERRQRCEPCKGYGRRGTA